jgi:hypothetical protein
VRARAALRFVLRVAAGYGINWPPFTSMIWPVM